MNSKVKSPFSEDLVDDKIKITSLHLKNFNTADVPLNAEKGVPLNLILQKRECIESLIFDEQQNKGEDYCNELYQWIEDFFELQMFFPKLKHIKFTDEGSLNIWDNS